MTGAISDREKECWLSLKVRRGLRTAKAESLRSSRNVSDPQYLSVLFDETFTNHEAHEGHEGFGKP
jgi:hypothetical protein